MNYYHIYRPIGLLSLVWALATFVSCIKEDRSGCDLSFCAVSVRFTDPYESDDPQRGLNTDEFSRVMLFIYDRRGQIVTTAELYECRLMRDYRLDVELSPGNYEMVVWVGTETFFYNFEATENIDMASMSLDIPEDHEINYWITPLYFGKTSFTVGMHPQTVIIPMLQYTNDINFTVTGLGSDHQYSFRIEDDNGKYSFKNSFLPCERFGYHSDELLYKSDHFESRVTLLRLGNGRSPYLTLTDDVTGMVIYPSYEGQETNLIALIKMAYQNNTYDFDARHIFDLTLEFDTGMKATVYVDNWEVIGNDYEI